MDHRHERMLTNVAEWDPFPSIYLLFAMHARERERVCGNSEFMEVQCVYGGGSYNQYTLYSRDN